MSRSQRVPLSSAPVPSWSAWSWSRRSCSRLSVVASPASGRSCHRRNFRMRSRVRLRPRWPWRCVLSLLDTYHLLTCFGCSATTDLPTRRHCAQQMSSATSLPHHARDERDGGRPVTAGDECGHDHRPSVGNRGAGLLEGPDSSHARWRPNAHPVSRRSDRLAGSDISSTARVRDRRWHLRPDR